MSRRDALLFAWVRRRTKGGWVSLWVVTTILWWWTRTSGRPEEEGWHRMDRMGASVARKSLQAAAAAAFEPCRPSARRALAARGASASDSDSEWQVMAHCVVQRQAHAVGHFALHVSKSGGTSLCRVFQTHCRTNPNVKENCSYRNMGFSPQWYRRHDPAMNDLSMPTWAMLRPHLYHDLECGELASFVRDRRIHALMSENTIPYDNYGDDDHNISPTTSTSTTATQVHRHRHHHHRHYDRPLCPQFINSIVMREPMKRLLSHYKQLLGDCHGSSLRPLKCLDAMMTQEDGSTAPRMSGLPNKIFDVERMTQLFDIVSDNYCTRSLSPKEVFGWNATLQEHPLGQNAIYSSALKALQSFDWVFLLDSPRMMQKSDNRTTATTSNTSVMVGDTDEEEDNDTLRNTLMLQQGLGLGPTVTLGHSRKAHQFSSSSSSNSGPTVSDPSQLQQRQSLDYRLWNEAQKLHDLDMESLRRMKPYFLDARTRATLLVNNSRGSSSSGSSRGAELSASCCGDICL